MYFTCNLCTSATSYKCTKVCRLFIVFLVGRYLLKNIDNCTLDVY